MRESREAWQNAQLTLNYLIKHLSRYRVDVDRLDWSERRTVLDALGVVATVYPAG